MPQQTAEIYKFISDREPCGHCGRQVKKKSIGNSPAYCDYTCGALAQPDKCVRTTQSTDGLKG